MIGTELRLLHDSDVDAAWGLAMDEALCLKYETADSSQPKTLRLYTYSDHSVLVGRYQRLESEVDLARAGALGVALNRRPTGGGTILMGSGQLGVSLTMKKVLDEHPRAVLHEFSRGIIKALESLGITATMRGKNDIEVDGKKIAGLGLYQSPGGGLLLHASILADLDISLMLDVLAIPASKLKDKAISSIRDRVTTLSTLLGERVDGLWAKEVVGQGFASALSGELHYSAVDESELLQAKKLCEERYETQEWLFDCGKHEASQSVFDLRTSLGNVEMLVSFQGDVIKSAMFTGNYNAPVAEFVAVEESLRWQRLDPEPLAIRLEAALATSKLFDPRSLVDQLCASSSTSVADRAAPRRIGSCYLPEV